MKPKESVSILCCCVLALFFLTTTALGATRNVPGDYATINDAIGAAGTGDTVLCQPGGYSGTELPVDFAGKAITVQCASPPNCTIGCYGTDPVGVVFENGEGTDSVLSGFTIIGAMNTPILCDGSSPTITNCVMRHNDAGNIGGIYCTGASPVINQCTIEDSNDASLVGGILGEFDSSPTITDCTFRNNTDSPWGAIAFFGGSPTISGCTVSDNNGELTGGMLFVDSSPTVTGCTLTLNVGGTGTFCATEPIAGGIVCAGGSPTISECTITYNQGDYAGGILCVDSIASPNITDSTISDNTGYVGGISFSDTSGTISDCNVVNNTGNG